jgi:hypothetical protein
MPGAKGIAVHRVVGLLGKVAAGNIPVLIRKNTTAVSTK